jgi:hypothetical protein
MKPVDCKVASPDAAKRKLGALKKYAKILCEDMSAMALLPLKLRISIVEIAHAEDPKLPPPAGRGAPQKSLAMQVARTVAEHFYGLTGTRPTRITPPRGGKAHGLFLEFLATNLQNFRQQGFGGEPSESGYQLCDGKIPERLGVFLLFTPNKPARIIRAPSGPKTRLQATAGTVS